MRLIEGKVWSIWFRYVNSQAAKVTKRVYVVAPTAEKAMGMVRAAISLDPNAAVEYVSLTETYDGVVVE